MQNFAEPLQNCLLGSFSQARIFLGFLAANASIGHNRWLAFQRNREQHGTCCSQVYIVIVERGLLLNASAASQPYNMLTVLACISKPCADGTVDKLQSDPDVLIAF